MSRRAVAALSTTGGIVAFLGTARFLVRAIGVTLERWGHDRRCVFWAAHAIMAAIWCGITIVLLMEVRRARSRGGQVSHQSVSL